MVLTLGTPAVLANFDEPIEDFLARWPEGIYEFEILAIEMNGNATISVGEFVTSE